MVRKELGSWVNDVGGESEDLELLSSSEEVSVREESESSDVFDLLSVDGKLFPFCTPWEDWSKIRLCRSCTR